MQPSEKYAVDYTDGNGLKWSKTIAQMYPSLGAIDNTIGISKYDADIMRKIYRKPDSFNAIYDSAITIGGLPGQAPDVIKYFQRSGYPTSDVNINTIIVNASTADGGAYAIGVNDDANNIINRAGMGSYRILRDVEYNKLLFNVRIREMSFTTHSDVIQKDLYEDPTYTDKNLKDIDDDKYYGIFYHLNGKVWNGSSWVNSSINPAYICTGSDTQTIQGAGSVFNNTFIWYSAAPLGTGQNIALLTSASNYYWSGENFNSKMNNIRYCLGLSEDITLKGSWTDNPDAVYSTIRQWLVDNSIAANTRVNFEICRELVPVGNDSVVLLTQDMSAYLDNDNNLVIWGSGIHTFFMVKGSSLNKMIAGHGLYYLTDENADLTGITPDTLHNSSAIWLGEMSGNGTTTGNWIKGADIENYTGYNKDGNINNPDFDPSGGGGGQESFDSEPSAYNDAYTTGVPSSQLYAMTLAQVNDMFDKLTNGGIIPANFEPGNAVISIQRYPFSLSSFASAVAGNITWTARPDVIGPETPTRIMFPPVGEEITGYPIYNPVKRVSLGSFKLSEFWTNYIAFLNREISASLYIPFCGIIEIDINAILNKTITVYLTIDVISGGCTAAVDINGCMYTTVSGSCSADMYFSTSNYGTIRAALRSNTAEQVYNVAQLAAGAIGAAASGGLTAGWATQAATGAGFNILGKAIKRTMMRNGVTPSVRGTAGDMSSWKLPMHCQLILSLPRPNHSSDSIYGHSHGFLTVSEKTVGSCSGLTVCDNPDVSNISTATDTEKEMIYNMLQNGVYV